MQWGLSKFRRSARFNQREHLDLREYLNSQRQPRVVSLAGNSRSRQLAFLIVRLRKVCGNEVGTRSVSEFQTVPLERRGLPCSILRRVFIKASTMNLMKANMERSEQVSLTRSALRVAFRVRPENGALSHCCALYFSCQPLLTAAAGGIAIENWILTAVCRSLARPPARLACEVFP